MKLHILPPSANSHGPMCVVKDLGMDVEFVNVFGKTRTPEFLAINPCHTAPTLELDDGRAIWESNAVMRYLCAVAPNGEKLYPSDPFKRAQIDLALDWRQTSMYPCIPSIGYIVFGMEQDTEKAKEDFKNLLEALKILTDIFLKDTQFVFSETPTIADLAIAPVLTFIKARGKFWHALPQAVKDYRKRVFEAFPGVQENFDMLDGMATGCSADGHDADP